MGSSAFAVPSLRALVAAGEQVALVITQDPKEAGRGRALCRTPVHLAAEALGLRAIAPPKLDAAARSEIAACAPEFIAVAAYGKILRPAVLAIPARGCVNVHASLLPAYRGASPLHFAILDGVPESGVTTMLIDEGLDTGALLLQRALPLAADETSVSLEAKLAEVGAELLLETLRGMRSGAVVPRPQDSARATLTRLLHKGDGRVDWGQTAVRIERLLRAFDPWPGAFTRVRGKKLALFRAQVVATPHGKRPGTVLAVEGTGPVVACADGALRLLEVQLEGKKRMPAAEFARGFRLAAGELCE